MLNFLVTCWRWVFPTREMLQDELQSIQKEIRAIAEGSIGKWSPDIDLGHRVQRCVEKEQKLLKKLERK